MTELTENNEPKKCCYPNCQNTARPGCVTCEACSADAPNPGSFAFGKRSRTIEEIQAELLKRARQKYQEDATDPGKSISEMSDQEINALFEGERNS